MTKPTKQQLQEESLEKKLGIPAIVFTLVTIVFNFFVNVLPFGYDAEGTSARWLAMIAIVAVFMNLVAYVYIKLGLLRGIFIISGVICTLIAAWAWFIASLSFTF